ncbi:MAG: hypothetical protein A3F92_09465 [Candidatus Rokubacteria bacterium RIFCSPLOWO2_12_FULL_71_22]|nr:MAG: hypothetical protein A3F92_09465 [Candidatus Rokubacteria bacterium RIFCSPLOWO2_12_FULL_71_22]
MSTHATKLKHVATGKLVDAELHDSLSLDDLLDAEALWAPAKIQIARELLNRSVPRSEWPQSLHWNWAEKAITLKPYAPGPFSAYRLFGLRAEERWQGLLLGCCVGHPTRLAPVGRDLVYVEFVETAPWNWQPSGIGQGPLFKGTGLQLVELAVRWSEDLDFRGRVGLHSLPQADSFYRGACGMSDLGPDPKYRQLRYFELDESHARTFLEEN